MPTLAVSTSSLQSRLKPWGPLNTSAYQLFGNLVRKISLSSGDDREGAFLFQRVSVLVQRFSAVLYMTACQPLTARTDRSVPNFVYLNF